MGNASECLIFPSAAYSIQNHYPTCIGVKILIVVFKNRVLWSVFLSKRQREGLETGGENSIMRRFIIKRFHQILLWRKIIRVQWLDFVMMTMNIRVV